MVSEFIAAVNQICSERGIDQESVFTALESAVLSAYKKEFEKEEVENLSVELDRETGKFKLIAKMTVVDKVKDNDAEISLVDAKKGYKKSKIGDELEVELPVVDFGRIAAQTAKQVIMQKINESERQSILDEYSGKVGEVFNALMQRMQRGQAVFEIGKAIAYMPLEEQIPNEFYKIGERYKVLLKSIDDTPSGKTLVVSRADPQFLEALFKIEVPEMESGVIEVKACAREAGSRSKIAVASYQEGIDPIGSCVGQRGMRIANVMSELGVEKIDIIEWNSDPENFIANSLSPAKVESVTVKDDTALVKVAEDQLSLAIGKEGQNVRLAYKLTGYKIDIQGPNADSKKSGSNKPIEKVVDNEKDEKPVEAVEESHGNDEVNVEEKPVAEKKEKKPTKTISKSVKTAKESEKSAKTIKATTNPVKTAKKVAKKTETKAKTKTAKATKTEAKKATKTEAKKATKTEPKKATKTSTKKVVKAK